MTRQANWWYRLVRATATMPWQTEALEAAERETERHGTIEAANSLPKAAAKR